VYGDGEQMRCFSYIDDCIFCLEKLALDTNIVREIINIGPDENPVTINQLVDIIATETGYCGISQHMSDRPSEVKYATCSADNARAKLGYKTKTDLITSVKNTVDWIRNKGTLPFDYSFPLEIINDKTPKTWKDRLM
jgi:UDP-glucose 4-epimerase